jgi:hypothetical protein
VLIDENTGKPSWRSSRRGILPFGFARIEIGALVWVFTGRDDWTIKVAGAACRRPDGGRQQATRSVSGGRRGAVKGCDKLIAVVEVAVDGGRAIAVNMTVRQAVGEKRLCA